MNRRFSALLGLAVLLASCSSQDRGISDRIRTQIRASKTGPLDLGPVGPQGWERVCIFGPYSTKKEVEQDLGFKWDFDSKSSASVDDGINLIVFVRGNEVLGHVDHPRRDGDFDSDKTPCTVRTRAVLPRGARSDGVPLFTVPPR